MTFRFRAPSIRWINPVVNPTRFRAQLDQWFASLARQAERGVNEAIEDATDLDDHIEDIGNPHSVGYTQLLEGEPQDGEPHARLNNAWQRVTEEAPIDGTEYLRQDAAWLVPNRLRWRGPWVNGATYEINDVSLDVPYLMVANTQTTDRPGPVNVGDPFYDLPDVPVWDTDGQFSGVAWTGAEYTITQTTEIVSYDVLVPELTDDTNYTIRTYSHPVGDPDSIIYQQIAEPVLKENEWTTVVVNPTLFTGGTVVGCVIDALNSGGSTAPGGTPADWLRQASDNNGDPTTGGWNTNINESLLRIHEETADAATIDLNGVIAGSSFQFVSVDDAAQSITFAAQSGETLVGQVYSWSVVQDAVGPGGAPPSGARCIVTIDVPVPAPTKYKQDLDGNALRVLPAGTTSRGVARLGGVPQSVDDVAFGVRANFQEVSVSDDWDYMAGLGGSGSGGGDGGGGVTEFEALTDTPVGYGVDGQFVTTDGSKIIYKDPGDLGYVLKAGDTMTGQLDFQAPHDATGAGSGRSIRSGDDISYLQVIGSSVTGKGPDLVLVADDWVNSWEWPFEGGDFMLRSNGDDVLHYRKATVSLDVLPLTTFFSVVSQERTNTLFYRFRNLDSTTDICGGTFRKFTNSNHFSLTAVDSSGNATDELARFEAQGTTMSGARAVVTKEKGDAAYAPSALVTLLISKGLITKADLDAL